MKTLLLIAAILLLSLVIVVNLINLIVRAQVRKVDFLRTIDSDKFQDSDGVFETLRPECSLLSILHVSTMLKRLKNEGLAEMVTHPADDDEDMLCYYYRITEAGRAYLREHSSS